MVNQPHAFKHRDVVRAVKAAKAAGIDASQVKVDPNTGEITVGPAPGGNAGPLNDLDSWLRRKDAPQA